MSNVSVVIPTRNEEVHIRQTVSSAALVGPVYVVDSESADRTREIAVELGAHVVEHQWEGYATQKNWTLRNLPLETDWVFFLDADETVTPELVDEIQQAITSTRGRWLSRSASIYLPRPRAMPRLVVPGLPTAAFQAKQGRV